MPRGETRVALDQKIYGSVQTQNKNNFKLLNFHQAPSVEILDYINNASTARLTELYNKLVLKFRVVNQNLWFNNKCLKNKVIPKYITRNIRIINESRPAVEALQKAKTTWLKAETGQWYSSRDNISQYLKTVHCLLTQKLHPIEFDVLDRDVRLRVSDIIQCKYEKQVSKLNKLIEENFNKLTIKSQQTKEKPITFFDRVMNLSNVTLNKNELNLLSKGLKYCPPVPNKKSDFENLAIDLEIALHKDLTSKHICSRILKKGYLSSIQNNNKFNEELVTLKNLKTKIKENNVIVTKADKGNTTVLLTRNDYVDKINDFLINNKIIEIKKDPTMKFNKNVKDVINSCKVTINPKDMLYLTTRNPLTPKFYGLPKIHKPLVPIRPVVSYLNAPAYKLSKKANSLIRNHSGFKPLYSVKNSLELVDKITKFKIPSNSKLISFDVVSLFTNVPVNKCKKIIEDNLNSNRINPVITSELLSILDVCVDQNYFQFNNKFYKQTDGLAMGNCLSPLLAEFYMNYLENIIFSHSIEVKPIVYWFRYVDDIICLFNGTGRQITKLHNFINSLDNNIKFTLELGGKKINFLDLTIDISNDIHNFTIFRKPTFSDAVIHVNSVHPFSYKLAAFHSEIHRLVSIPLTKINFDIELKTIKQIATNNGYDRSLIDNLLHKKRIKLAEKMLYKGITNKDTGDVRFWRRINYLGNISLKIKKQLSKVVRPAFYCNNSLGSLLINNKDTTHFKDKSGIYRLQCSDCQHFYIGKTARTLNIRVAEHLAAFRLNKDTSTFANHLLLENHSFDTDVGVKLLHKNTCEHKLFYQEILEINRAQLSSFPILNEQLNLPNSPLLYPFK